jgi:hypothetical protein
MSTSYEVRVSYGPVTKVLVEGDKVPLLRRTFRVESGESYDAARLLRSAGYHVQPGVTHPNGSGGTPAYIYVPTKAHRPPTVLRFL